MNNIKTHLCATLLALTACTAGNTGAPALAAPAQSSEPVEFPSGCGDACLPLLLGKYGDHIVFNGEELRIRAKNGKSRTYPYRAQEDDPYSAYPISVHEGAGLLLVEVTGYETSSFEMVDLESGEAVTGIISCVDERPVAFSPDGQRFLAWCKDFDGHYGTSISVYRVVSGRAPVQELALSGDQMDEGDIPWGPENVRWTAPDGFRFTRIEIDLDNGQEVRGADVDYALRDGVWRER